MPTIKIKDIPELKVVKLVDLSDDSINKIAEAVARKIKVDAEEVVRCCDCKYFQCNVRQDGYLPYGEVAYECKHWGGSCDPLFDFCSYGEAKDDNNN